MAIITIEQVREFAQANPDLVQVKWNESGLGVVKYKNRVFYDGMWNEILEECRGMVIDKDWNIVSLPFTKIYNFGIEDRAPKLHHTDVVTVYDKINGFMAAATYHAATDQIVYSTTGSLNSDFVQYIKDSVAGYQNRFEAMLKAHSNHTFLFECVHIQDPHIVPTEPGMYYLGHRAKDLSVQFIYHSVPDMMPPEVKLIKSWVWTVGELLDIVATYEGEGFVIESQSYRCKAKIKTPYYLVMKFLARANVNKLKDMLQQTKWPSIDEEFYPLMEYIKENPEKYFSMGEQEKLEFLRVFFRQQVRGA